MLGHARHVRALSAVNWTRGTGGTCWGSDEYAQDAAREQPGYNPVQTKQRFDPVGQAELQASADALYATYRGARRRSRAATRTRTKPTTGCRRP